MLRIGAGTLADIAVTPGAGAPRDAGGRIGLVGQPYAPGGLADELGDLAVVPRSPLSKTITRSHSAATSSV